MERCQVISRCVLAGLLFWVACRCCVAQSRYQFPNYALPGDLIVRHGRNIIGPPLLTGISQLTGGVLQMEDIPHMGMLLKNGKVFDLQREKLEGKDHGVISKSDWDDPTRFKNPGFFSVLESPILIKHNGKQKTFRDLSPEIKSEIRKKVCEIAESYIGKDVGEYGARAHCGDATIGIYDKALAEMGITVQRYKGASAFTKDLPGLRGFGLVDGKLRDWFVNDWFTFGAVMDPSEADDKLPRVGPPQASAGGKESGVSMKIDVNQEAFREDETGAMGKMRENILKSRPGEDSLSWPAEKEEKRK